MLIWPSVLDGNPNEEMPMTDQDKNDCDDDRLKKAEADLKKGEAELKQAERDIDHAEAEIEEIEKHHKDREIEVKVDGKIKRVAAGVYVVSAFKALVGVAADRELDVIKDGTLHPLDDNAKIEIHECEVFVSHVRSGGSS